MRFLFVLFTIAMVAAVLLHAFAPGEGARIYLIVVVALFSFAVVQGALLRFGRIERRLRNPFQARKPSLPRFVERAERQLEIASVSLAQFEPLRKQLRAVAEQRLARHGCRLGSDRSRELLGRESSLVLERTPDDRFARGPRAKELHDLIEALENL